MRGAAIILCAWALVACGSDTEPTDQMVVIPPSSGAAPKFFSADAPWNSDISKAPLDAESPKVIAGLSALGGFGSGSIIIDFDFHVLTADETTPMLTFTEGPGFYEPDCDFMPVPVPPNGALEGQVGYQCLVDRDCHLVVHHVPSNRLYEMWRADITGGIFKGGCLAVWDLTRKYPATGRGVGCTSADAAGFPIAPLLFTADEVAAGEIPHAIRFILPNDRIRRGVYVAPATHSTSATRGSASTPPYGARFRLRADFPVDLLPAGARVVARALQRHGMFLADGGSKALTAQNDRFTKAKWVDGNKTMLGERDLAVLQITDFQMVEGGPRIPFVGECERNQ